MSTVAEDNNEDSGITIKARDKDEQDSSDNLGFLPWNVYITFFTFFVFMSLFFASVGTFNR